MPVLPLHHMARFDLSDDNLVIRARAGDREALDALLSRYQARVYRFSLKMCRDPADASDVLQETLIALARSIRNLRGESSLSTWLYTVARSYCIKKRRNSKFAPRQVESLETAAGAAVAVPDQQLLPDDQVAARELDAALAAALHRLSEEHREVLLLRDGEGLAANEVAQVLGISIDAVKSRLHRARLTLRNELLPLLGERPAGRDDRRGRCPDVLTTYSRHLEGEIGAEVCRQMEQHLAGCRHCTNACASLKKSLAICSTSPGTAVPEDVQARVKRAIRDVLDVLT